MAYANEDHHNISKFSFVSIHAEEDGEEVQWYAKLIAFLEFDVDAPGDSPGEFGGCSVNIDGVITPLHFCSTIDGNVVLQENTITRLPLWSI